ncbi:MAG: sulfatase [Planctomycetaceae bacterium]|nr:sulfatase [Planctomycetaceae bacterium]
MNPLDRTPLEQTRRHFFQDCRVGLGAMALGTLLDGERGQAASKAETRDHPLAPRPTHFKPQIKNVIFLFMAGGPSQLELFDHKPKLQSMEGQVIPDSYVENKRFAFLKKDAKLLGTRRKFQQHGAAGVEISECLPHLASIGDELAVIRSMSTDVFNHGPAKFFMNTGYNRFGRPSMGAWVTYGIGSESRNLPGFVVLQSGPRGPRGGAPNWGSGFLPTTFQGVPFRNQGQPILNLANPQGINRNRQRQFIEAVNDFNRIRLEEIGDPEIATRIASYEMAFRMQTSAPELMTISRETPETLALYGAEPGVPSFANNCLLARRLVQRGVRFVQLYHTDWDHHGNKGTELGESLDKITREVDRPAAALIMDLKRLGMLDETLVIWGGEFGRTPQGEPRQYLGRDHHIEAFTMWLAGGGIQRGITLGKTDELGYYPVEDQVHVHDLQATVLHLLGLDHLKLTFRFQGRDFRLTDVAGKVVSKLLA